MNAGKTFESWFSSSDEHDVLRKKKLINCIYCDSTSIKKSVMAPNLFSKTNKILKILIRKKNKKTTFRFKKIYRKKLQECW